jgi:hypothetical protein
MANENPTFAKIVRKDQAHQVLGAARRTGARVREVIPSGQPFTSTPNADVKLVPAEQVGVRLSGNHQAFDAALSNIQNLTSAARWSRFRAWMDKGTTEHVTVTGNVEVVHYPRLFGKQRGEVVVPETGESLRVRGTRDVVAVYVHDPINGTSHLVSRTRAKNLPTQEAVDLVRGTKKD